MPKRPPPGSWGRMDILIGISSNAVERFNFNRLSAVNILQSVTRFSSWMKGPRFCPCQEPVICPVITLRIGFWEKGILLHLEG